MVRVLPAKRDNSVVDIHDEHDLPLQVVSLMMRDNILKVPELFVDGGCWYTRRRRGFDGAVTWRFVYQTPEWTRRNGPKVLCDCCFTPTRYYYDFQLFFSVQCLVEMGGEVASWKFRSRRKRGRNGYENQGSDFFQTSDGGCYLCADSSSSDGGEERMVMVS